MSFVLFHFYFFAALLCLREVSCAAFSNGQVQPGVYPAPALPSNFTKKPQYWRSPNATNPALFASRGHLGPSIRQSRKPRSSSVSQRQSGTSWAGWPNVRYIFSFGDSYTSTGFNVHGTQPYAGNPLGNPAYPGATSANGPNYVDFLSTTYNESYIQTYNFGYGGATVDPALVASPYGLIVQSFEQQVTQGFLPTYTDGTVPWSATDTLFTIFFGINDVILSYARRNDSLNLALIKDYEGLVNQLYAAGARNFLFMNVIPVDLTPGSLDLSDADRGSLASYIGAYNWRLGHLTYYLHQRHPDTSVFYLDTNWLFTRVIDYPSQFAQTAGYRNTTQDCPAYAQ
ncbi:MAG: hypothetical protein Q9191_002861 [Dirinaria sp. TL-2023a]